MGITTTIKSYIHNRIELAKLQSVEWSSALISDLIGHLIFIVALLFALLFVSIWAAVFLAEKLDNSHIGFAIVATFYLIIGFLFKFFHKGLIEKPVRDKLIETIMADPQPEPENPHPL